MYRKPVNKQRAAKSFRSKSMHTKGLNMKNAPMRGGFRL